MNTSVFELDHAQAMTLSVTDEELAVTLTDGRLLVVPLVWFPRLIHATSAERNDWRLVGHGAGFHWPQLDEDLSIKGLLLGHRSQESPASLARWLALRPTTTP